MRINKRKKAQHFQRVEVKKKIEIVCGVELFQTKEKGNFYDTRPVKHLKSLRQSASFGFFFLSFFFSRFKDDCVRGLIKWTMNDFLKFRNDYAF